MVVQHNLTAMNSNRMLGLTTASQAKSTEKLSSGYKINRAADDAAGLSISEKMRKQIRGLTQASSNAQDGISTVQTAEGALNEVQDMLQRMNELAVKAANGTNSVDDREYIQNEVDQLVTEIDRVAETTKFNETYLLKGDKSAPQTSTISYTGGTSTLNISADPTSTAITTKTAGSGTAAAVYELDLSGLTSTGAGKMNFTVGTKKYTVDVADGDDASAIAGKLVTAMNGDKITDGTAGEFTASATGAKISLTAKNQAAVTTALPTAFSVTGKPQLYDADGNAISQNGLDSYIKASGTGFEYKANKQLYSDAERTVVNEADLGDFVASADTKTASLTLKLHVGADATSNNQIAVNIEAMDATTLGVKTAAGNLQVSGSDDKNALGAIETIKAAIQKVSTQRSALGAVQNRLEHTINNLDNVVENTTSAESQIRDTDMATEMVKYSNNNILAQAGQAMLAQANQSNQGVLSLLQ